MGRFHRHDDGTVHTHEYGDHDHAHPHDHGDHSGYHTGTQRVDVLEALQRSLNLPAVALLDRVGPLRFAATLRAAGVTLKLPRGADPSLPLALGGDGITLRQAAALYAALATDGTGGSLRSPSG